MGVKDVFFGPLAKDYCSLFLFLSVVGLFYIVLAVFAIIALVFAKKSSPQMIASIISALAMGIVIYIQNRLLYNICLR
jgi:uncharacterized membrane protein YoaK (UPF0700 family)